MKMTYITTNELAGLIKYDARTIRNDLKDHVLLEGRHYIRPFGQRKILFLWENIQEDMHKASDSSPFASMKNESQVAEDVKSLFH